MKKITMALCLGLMGSLNTAVAGDLTHYVNVTGEVVSSCSIDQTVFNVDLGRVSGLTVGKAEQAFVILCSEGTEYTITPTSNYVNAGYGTIDAFKDGAYTEAWTTSSPYVGYGNGKAQVIDAYFRWSSENSPGIAKIDDGEGAILGVAGTMNATMTFVVTYN